MKKLAIILVSIALLAACESDTLTEERSGAGVNLSGRWTGFLSSVNFLPADIFATLEIRQQDLIDPGGPDASRVALRGILSFTRRHYGDCAAGGTIDSEETTLIGNRIDMTIVSEAGLTFNFSGDANENRIRGQYLAQGSCTVDRGDNAEEAGDDGEDVTISHTGTFLFNR